VSFLGLRDNPYKAAMGAAPGRLPPEVSTWALGPDVLARQSGISVLRAPPPVVAEGSVWSGASGDNLTVESTVVSPLGAVTVQQSAVVVDNQPVPVTAPGAELTPEQQFIQGLQRMIDAGELTAITLPDGTIALVPTADFIAAMNAQAAAEAQPINSQPVIPDTQTQSTATLPTDGFQVTSQDAVDALGQILEAQQFDSALGILRA
jgi:hypothetical protein